MKRSEIIFGLLRIPSDIVTVSSALLLAYILRVQSIDLMPGMQLLEPAHTLPSFAVYIQTFFWPALLLFLGIAALLKLYLIRVTLSFFREFSRISLSIIVWVGVIMGWYFFVRKQLFYSRAILLHATFLALFLVTVGRILLLLIQRALLRRGIGVRRVLSIGHHPLAPRVEAYLQRDPRYDYIGQVHSLEEARSRASGRMIDLIIQTDPSGSDETNSVIDFCRSHQIGYSFLPPVLIDVPHLLSVYRFGSVPLLRFHPTPLDGWGAVYKRGMDIAGSALLLTLLSPIFAAIALLVKCDSSGPIFYRSNRVGQRGRNASTLKFRSMVKNADAMKADLLSQSHRQDGPLFKVRDDPRITRIGKSLRRWSIDELPQLMSVLKGDLSLVGPRPHLPEEVCQYTEFQQRVFTVKPGITGLAQISGRSNLSFEEEVRLDLQYIEEWSPWLDAFILWRTIGVVLRGDGAD